MANKSQDTIDKALAVVQKRIEKLTEKKAQNIEKYPYDMYGMKADNMNGDIDDEIKDLQKFLNVHKSRADMKASFDESQELIESMSMLLNDCKNTAITYGEISLAHRLGRMIDRISKRRRA